MEWLPSPLHLLCPQPPPQREGDPGMPVPQTLIISAHRASYTGILFSTLYLLVLVFCVDKTSFMQPNLSVLIVYWHKSSTTSTKSSAKPFRGENLAQKAQACWRNVSYTTFLNCMQLVTQHREKSHAIKYPCVSAPCVFDISTQFNANTQCS